MVSWQVFPSPLLTHPSRFSRASNSLSLPFQMPATQARKQLMSFIEYFKFLFPDQMPQKDWTRTFMSQEPLLSSVM